MHRERGSMSDKQFHRDSRQDPKTGKVRRPVGSNDRIGMRFSRRSTALGISATGSFNKQMTRERATLTNATSLSSLRNV